MGCNSTYRLRYWNFAKYSKPLCVVHVSCNSTYRLRYWNYYTTHHVDVSLVFVATVLTVYGIETFGLASKRTIDIALQQYLPFTVYDDATLVFLT